MAIGLQELSVEDIPITHMSGTAGFARKRCRVYIRGIAVGADTLDLASYLPVTGILNASLITVGGTPGTCALTWSGTTITLEPSVSGAVETNVLAYY